LGKIHNTLKNYRISIANLAKYIKYTDSSHVNQEFIHMFFPLLYLDEVLNNSEDIDPFVILGLIRQESAFDVKAVSSARALGLMQVLPSTAKQLGAKNKDELFEPGLNIKFGADYLKKLILLNENQIEYALASYNAGPTHVRKWQKRFSNITPLLFVDLMPFAETRNYVNVVLRNAYWYERLVLKSDHKNKDLFKKRSQEASWQSELLKGLVN